MAEFVNGDRGRGMLSGVPESWRDNTDQRQRVLVWLQRRTMALGIYVAQQPRDVPLRRHAMIASGFVVRHAGRTWWGTAGHVLVEIEQLRSAGLLEHARCRWYDGHPSPEASFYTTQLLDGRELIRDTNEVVDLGLVELTALETAAVDANPCLEPFTIDDQPASKGGHGEGLYILGFPDSWSHEQVHQTVSGRELRIDADSVAVPVTEIVDPTDPVLDSFKTPRPDAIHLRVGLDHFAGERALSRLVGVSGGPLVAVERTKSGDLRDFLVGVQSKWLPESRIVRAEPINRLFAFLRWLESK